MQKPLIPALFICFLLVLGCGKSNDDLPENADRWAVTFYQNDLVGSDTGDDTDLFSGYTFEFNTNDNTLEIFLPNGSSQQAQWGNQNNVSFIIKQDNPVTPVSYLIGTWEVEVYNDTTIKLKWDTSNDPQAANAPELEFTKQ
jgi:hypothetical protein